MPVSLTEAEFSKHVGSKFLVKLEPQALELELLEVKGYLPGPNDQTGMERFSVFFKGPREIQLPQRVYLLNHERMGEFEIFLVPIACDEQGFRYEAVFNYFKK
jgi:hypothetical protein